MNKGTIFSIEEFAINDGPGIRTTVFLKGCPLRCAWCHNPEGLSPLPQKMETMDGPRICGEEVDAGTLADRILKDKDFLKMNNGGVTFTGGEPTFQPAFLIEVLELLRGEIHRAVETSGFCPGEVFEAVLRETDYILFDIKHADDEVHKRYTRASNLPIKENLHRLIESDKPFVVRVPLIPGVNDTIQNMDDIAELIANAGNLQRVELLKYHKTAGAKYSRIGMTYNPPFDTELAPAVHTEAFNKRKIKTLIL